MKIVARVIDRNGKTRIRFREPEDITNIGMLNDG